MRIEPHQGSVWLRRKSVRGRILQLDLLRHGECVGGARFFGTTDVPLTPRGWRQMQQAVDGEGEWAGIIASPLRRCAAFAVRLAARHRLPLALDVRLAELHFGTWEGASAAQILAQDAEALCRFWQDPLTYPPPGGEHLTAFESRLRGLLDELLQRHVGQRLLLVTHGGVIRALLGLAWGLEWPERLALAVPRASLHRLRLASRGDLRANAASREGARAS